MRTTTYSVMLLTLSLAAALHGQDPEDAPPTRLERLVDNLDLITLTVSLDRTTPYFPGEAATVTVTLTNPTAAPVEVPDPRAPGVSAFALAAKGGFGTKDKSEWSIFEPPHMLKEQDIPSTVLRPGQTLSVTFPPTESLWPYPSFSRVPDTPGDYRLRFRLGGEVEFQVEEAFLEASAIVPLQRFRSYQTKYMKEPKTLQDAAVIVAAQLNDEHLVFAAQRDFGTTYRVEARKADGALSDRTAYSGAPWVRLLAVPSKVTNLTGTADPTRQITIEYTTADGGGGKVYLDQNRYPVGSPATRPLPSIPVPAREED